MPAVGDVIRLSVERIVPGGDGMGRHEGIAAFVPMSAPGDELTARVVEARPGYLRGELVELLAPGPGRAESICPLYGECGGCNLMHLSYRAQLEAKLELARDAWRRAGGIDTVDFEVVESEPFGYRNRAQFHRTPSGSVGYARRSSSSALEVRSCPVLAAPLARWLEWANHAAGKTAGGPVPGKDRFVAFGRDDKTYIEGIDREVDAEIGGKRFRFDVGGFFQSNLGMVERLVPAVCGGHSGERAADLYCGVGLFGAFLKDTFSRLACVEQDKRSIGYACSNVGAPASFAASSMEDWTKSAQARERYDYVVVDPPRAGLSASVRSWLTSSRPELVGYVSCDPVSLARDAGALVKAGYSVEYAAILDFYPQTSHVESYARFRLD